MYHKYNNTLISANSLRLVYKMIIYKNRIDNEIFELLSDAYFIHKEKDFSDSKKKFRVKLIIS